MRWVDFVLHVEVCGCELVPAQIGTMKLPDGPEGPEMEELDQQVAFPARTHSFVLLLCPLTSPLGRRKRH